MSDRYESPTGSGRLWAYAVLLGGVVFALDLALPLGIAGGVPYVALVLLASRFSDPRAVVAAAFAGTVLTVVGYFASENAGAATWVILANRALAIFVIWIVALALRRTRRLEDLRSREIKRLETLGKIERAFRDLDFSVVMPVLLDTLLDITGADRAWLGYPCNPYAPSWRVTAERTRPEYPGAGRLDEDLPMGQEAQMLMRLALDSEDPVELGPLEIQRHTPELGSKFRIRSQIMTTVHPSSGDPWLLGLHQCSRIRKWSHEDRHLIASVARRLADTLNAFRAQENLKESELRFRTLLDQSPFDIIVHDLDGTIIKANQRARDNLGYEAEHLPGLTLLDLTVLSAAEVDTLLTRTRRSKAPQQLETSHRRRDGSRYPVEVHCGRIVMGGEDVVLWSALDTSERATREQEKGRLLEELRQAQKMESIGRLAGGVAHDFNNMLTVILGHTSLALEDLGQDHPLHSPLSQIRDAAEQSAGLTGQLLAYARKQPVSPEVLDLNASVGEMLAIIRPLIGEEIGFRWRPAPEVWPVEMDPTQLHQVLTNLCLNAKDASNGQGHVIVSTANMTVEEFDRTHPDEVRPGDYVLLTVHDRGSGIEPHVMDSIFDPFFTTKKSGAGTGLGLSTVLGIVKQNSGFITARSAPGRGSTFAVYLPRVDDSLASGARPTPPTSLGGGTVLLVEDDDSVRGMVYLLLRRLGFEVLSTGDPQQALGLIEGHEGVIDLVLTDVVMPGMNGRELADHLRHLHPELKCLFMSGYTADIITEKGVLVEGTDFIAKPFSLRGLRRKLETVLS
jgi:PAS domain S-box-containing protein